MKIKNISRLKKFFLIGRVKRNIYFHYLPLVFKKKLEFKYFNLFNKRVSTLLKTFKSNKMYKINKNIILDNNVPAYKTKAFYTYLDRYLNFTDKLNCSTTLISITNECSFNCKHCYQKFDTGSDTDIEILAEAVKDLIEHGVTTFRIEGGDPFLKFDRLKRICQEIGDKGEVSINSTGNGITLEKLKILENICNLKSITFSISSPIPDDVNFLMGQDYSWNTIKHGLKLCQLASIPSSLNCCLHSGHFENGNFEYLMEIAKGLEVCHVMIIHPKAAGAWLQGQFPAFTQGEIADIKDSVKKFNLSRKFRKYPALTAQIIEEDSEHYGCAGGGTDRFYINAKGDVQPCEFLNISFGNIKEEKFLSIFNRMREHFKTPGTNWLCENYSTKVFNLFQIDEILPINKDKSKMIYEKWDRGDATPLYYRIENELKDH